jgi:hypothetical protein
VLGEGGAVRWIGGSFSVTLAQNTLRFSTNSTRSPTQTTEKLDRFWRFKLSTRMADLISIAVLLPYTMRPG